ncbi:hypothetical protein KIN20_011255 [Parelaphostrongylus tenuis]|uniref:SCP domain-containing protein n=1 Tax=Parelaphostrongylus tenuis TaxID=148309 RepID=A0AAD5MUQ2_PARTN|nr:hypothetical protein KIN20_011255 [Parelaphostrongylus tenuis]
MEDTEYEPTDEEYYFAQPRHLKEDCGNVTGMSTILRVVSVVRHNYHRIKLAQGRQKNGNGPDAMYFPKASDMSLLVYDCELEKAAHQISKRCHNENNLDFRNVGSNSATYHFRSTINDSDIIKMIDSFFNTSTQSRPLINLTPTENDTPMIPFLQMAVAYTTRIGCAYTVCNSSFSSPFVLFVCQYGEPHVRINTPIYTAGQNCSTCSTNTCVANALCNRTLHEIFI